MLLIKPQNLNVATIAIFANRNRQRKNNKGFKNQNRKWQRRNNQRKDS